MNRLDFCLLCLAVLCASLSAGCSGGSSLSTQYVEGVVTLDGNPVAEATVMFVPVAQGQGLSATGMTDASGVYKLTAANAGDATAKAGSGTLPGEYYVGVVKAIAETAMTEEEAYEKKVPFVGPQPGESPKVTHVVPEKFNDPQSSGLKATVKAGNNDIPIKLSST